MILHNEHLLVEAVERGAQLMRIYSPEFDHEYLWINDPEIWPWRSPNLFPIIGELKDGQYSYDGKIYPMGRHGFVRDAAFEGHQHGNTMQFKLLSSAETLKIYPFAFELSIEYKLVGKKLEVWYHVTNTGEKEMPFSIGAHPAFTASPIFDHYLRFETNETRHSDMLNDEGLRTGKYRSGIEQGRIQLSEQIFEQDALILEGLESSYCELRSNSSPRMIRFHFGQFPWLGIWSKPSSPYVCIEPWQGVADHHEASGMISEKEGIINLLPESLFRIGYAMEFF